MDFTGKVVLITGASGRVGAPTAQLFATLNASLALVSRNEEKLKGLVDFCHACNGNKPLAVKIDLTLGNSCEEVIQRTLQAFGRLDVLVNCAAKLNLNSMFDENIDGFDELFNINLKVPYKLTHCALPYLVQTRGNVVNLKAAQSDIGKPGYLNVSITNSAIETFTKAAAFEVLDAGVRINAVNVSLAEPDLIDDLDCKGSDKDFGYDSLESQHEVRVMEPERVAKMIALVASGAKRYRSLSGAFMYDV